MENLNIKLIKENNEVRLLYGENDCCTFVCENEVLDLCYDILNECFCVRDQVNPKELIGAEKYEVICKDVTLDIDAYLQSNLCEILAINQINSPKAVIITGEYGVETADRFEIIMILTDVSCCFTNDVKVVWSSYLNENIKGENLRLKMAYLK